MMIGELSPVMKKVVEEESSYPSPSAKIKINKAIGRYKLLSSGDQWKEYMDDIKFALADLLVARGDEKDYEEALKYYDFIIAKSQNKMLKGRALVGKAELFIPGVAKIDPDEAIKMCRDGKKMLGNDLKEFFTAKGIAVEAELYVRKSGKKSIKTASKLFSSLIRKRHANPYFRARAMVGKAELILYHGVDSLSHGIKMCDEARKIMYDRTLDYFFTKSRVIEAELLAKRGSTADLSRAESLCGKVISNTLAHKDLSARAKLTLAEISKRDRAEKLYEEVLEQEGVDPYLIEKAKFTEKSIRKRFN